MVKCCTCLTFLNLKLNDNDGIKIMMVTKLQNVYSSKNNKIKKEH